MSSTVRTPFNTWPEIRKDCHVHAPVHDTGRGHLARGVTNLTLNTVVVDLVARSQRVDIVRERPILNTGVRSGAVAAEAQDWIQDDRIGEGSSVKLFLPVSETRSTGAQ